MEVLTNTQFAKFGTQFNRLPPFIAKKMEEAMVK
jgi:hypothetical protein